jgi:16S rRNA (cytosine967-C5)-methyltransferase
MDARTIVLRILAAVERYHGNLEGIVDTALRESRIDRRDKRFVFEIAYGVIRRRLTLDYVIDSLIETPALRKNAVLRRILQIGLYQLLYMDRVPDYAAVNESVRLAKSESEARDASGVVNGVLRKVIAGRKLVVFPETMELVERLSIEYSHPRWMVERWLKNFGLSSTKKLLAFNNERPDSYLRRKIRNISRQQFEGEIRSLCEPATGYLNLYYRLKKNIIPEELTVLEQGLCNVQAPSSGWVVALVDAQRGEKILDVCSSPGGKAAMLSEIVGDTGSVCACDNRWRRIELTRDTLRTMQCGNTYLLLCDGRNPPFEGAFDKVLVDAPCSATGVMHRHPDARWVRQAADIEANALLQRSLLESASCLVGQGGIIVYSTCSIEPEENRIVVESFLGDHPEFEHCGCPSSIPQAYVDNQGFLCITPHGHGMDGMFGARLRRIRQSV